MVYCPKCGKELDTRARNIPIFQPSEIRLVDTGFRVRKPLPARQVEPDGRYCCFDCSICFIVEAGF